MSYRGLAKGNTIELDVPLPFPEGQALRVTVTPLFSTSAGRGSPQALRQAMHRPPHLSAADIAELEAAIEQGKLPLANACVLNERP
jgi:hypothetical protein